MDKKWMKLLQVIGIQVRMITYLIILCVSWESPNIRTFHYNYLLDNQFRFL